MPGRVSQVFHVIEMQVTIDDLPRVTFLGYSVANETALRFLNDNVTDPESWEHWITKRENGCYTVKWRKPLKKGEHV